MTPYLKVLPGEEVSAVYKGFKVVPSTLDPTKETFRYILELDNREKFWDNSKTAIAFVFDQCGEGDIVLIKNSGDEKKGNYSVSILVGQNAPLEELTPKKK